MIWRIVRTSEKILATPLHRERNKTPASELIQGIHNLICYLLCPTNARPREEWAHLLESTKP